MRLPIRFRLSEFNGLLTCFLLGLVVRLIPELLAFPYPVGFDTIYYAAAMKSGVVWPHWSSFFASSWLFPAFSVLLYKVFGGDPFMLLKVLAPLLFGLNVAGVYWFSRKMLCWDARLSLLAGGFFAVQLASLRISWDLLRNTLGMGLLLFTLPFVRRLNSKLEFAGFVLLSLLTVFAHEYAAVTLAFIISGLVFWRLVKKRSILNEDKRLLIGFAPALAVFLTGIYLRIFPVRYIVETNIINTGDAVNPHPFGLFFLTDYLKVRTSVHHYAGYLDLLLSVAALFCLLYLPYLFLVLQGFFRHEELNVWTALLLVGTFGCLVLPFSALELWHRWMFMLVYPFTFYTVNWLGGSIKKFNGGDGKIKRELDGKVKGMLLLTIMLGAAYLATPLLMNSVNVGIFSIPTVNRYFSFAPTVPYIDVESVVKAMKWLNENMDGNSCALLQQAFLEWGRLYLSDSYTLIHFTYDVDSALNSAFKHGFSNAYFVWWNEPIGWYGLEVPKSFAPVFEDGRIAVFKYMG